MINQKDFLSTIAQNKSDYVSVLIININLNIHKENFCMIKEKLLLYNDYSDINKKCFCCKKCIHIIEECPKLHYVPDIERIIKKINFPKFIKRYPFQRRWKKSKNVFLTCFNNYTNQLIQNQKSDQQTKKKEFEDPEEDSNYEELEPSEISEFNSEVQPSSKKEVLSSFASHKNTPTLSTKRMIENLKDESSPSIVIVSSNNEIKENVFFKGSEQQKLTKILSTDYESKVYKNSELAVLSSQNKLPDMRVNFEIDKVGNFKKYFPSFNIKQIIKNFENSWRLAKEIQEKYSKKYKDLKNYTFYVNAVLEKFLNEKKCLLKPKTHFTMKNSLSYKGKTLCMEKKCSPLHKKSVFEFQDKKTKIPTFTDLINKLVAKSKQNQFRSKGKTFVKK